MTCFVGCSVLTLIVRSITVSFAKDVTTLTLHELASLLRMSTKYVLPSLRQSVITHLEVLYPSTLDDFLSEARLTLLPADFNGITGVNLGLECDVPAILPVAYYLCSTLRPIEILNGITVADTGMRIKLSETAHAALATFQERWLLTAATTALQNRPSFDCVVARCRNGYPRSLSVQDVLMQNPFLIRGECFFSFQQESYRNDDMCANCTRSLDRRRVSMQKSAWVKLPYCCELGTWEELQKEC